jgi:hypothetical protein
VIARAAGAQHDGPLTSKGPLVWYKQVLAHRAIEDVEVAIFEGKAASGRQELRLDGTVRREGGFSVCAYASAHVVRLERYRTGVRDLVVPRSRSWVAHDKVQLRASIATVRAPRHSSRETSRSFQVAPSRRRLQYAQFVASPSLHSIKCLNSSGVLLSHAAGS